MLSRWDNKEAAKYSDDPVALRAYSSRLLGAEPALVQHGGGNTSVKATRTNLFGETEELLYVKGSGWDLATIEPQGFAPVRMDGLDTGYFGGYIGCSPEKGKKAIEMMKTEFDELTNTPVSQIELDRAKKYLIGKHDISLQKTSPFFTVQPFTA